MVQGTRYSEAATAPTRSVERPDRPVRLHWWKEAAIVAVFYVVYSAIRNQFGSARVGRDEAFDNAEAIIDVERALRSYHERAIQSWFLDWDWFMWFWNVFYGTFHFGVTIFALVWLYHRFPERYPRWRNTLAVTTASALIGFSMFPLMPPRLLDEGLPYGGLGVGGGGYGFIDSLQDYGGLWSFDSGTMQSVSNQYAAMPSLHFAWALFCACAVIPTLRSRLGRWLLALYPVATLFAIIVTGNHYWIDALGGVLAVGIGYVIGTWSADWWRARVTRRALEDLRDDHRAPAEAQ